MMSSLARSDATIVDPLRTMRMSPVDFDTNADLFVWGRVQFVKAQRLFVYFAESISPITVSSCPTTVK